MKKRLLVLMITAFAVISAVVCAAVVVYAADESPISVYDRNGNLVGDYQTLAEAVAEAPGRGSIVLNKDVTVSGTLDISIRLTVKSAEGSKHTITYSGSGVAFSIGAAVTFQNIVIDAANGGGFVLNADANLTLRDSAVNAAGMSNDTAPVRFAADGAKLTSTNTDITGKFIIVHGASVPNTVCTINGGTYHMTGTYAEGLLHGDGTGGRLMQFNGSSGAQITINSGSFIAHYGYVFNFSQPDCEVTVNGGSFYYDGPDRNLMIFKYNAKLTVNGGVFNTPNISSAISLDTELATSETYVPTATVYGGTFMAKGGSPIGVGTKIIKDANEVVTATYKAKLTVYGGAFFDVYNNIEMDLSDNKPQRIAGAAVSLDSANPGIRFDSVITPNTVSEITKNIDEGTTLSYGTWIVPTSVIKGLASKNEMFTGVNGFNFDIITAAGLTAGTDYYDYPCGLVATDDGNYRIFAIHPVAAKDFATDFSAVAYIKCTMNGNEHYICSNYNGGDVRNVKEIAHRALIDDDAAVDAGGSSRYTADQLAILKTYDTDTNTANTYMTAKVLSLNILTHDADRAKNGDSVPDYTYYGTTQKDSDYSIAKRYSYVKAMFNYTQPDVMLFQEFSGKNFWGTMITLNGTGGRYTSPQFPGYEWVNYGNRRGVLWENNTTSYMGSTDAFHAHNFVVYNTAKFEHIASGTEFVSKTGTRYQDDENLLNNNEAGTAFGGSDKFGAYAYNDLGDFTWVLLKDKATGIYSIYASTHTYNGSVSRYAYMLDNIQCLTKRLEEISAEMTAKYASSLKQSGKIPVTVGGDFNMQSGLYMFEPVYEHLTEIANFIDSNVTGTNSGTARSFGNSRNGSGGSSRHGVRIDYIFTNGTEPFGYEVLNGQVKLSGGSYIYDPYPVLDSGNSYDISDHLPIMTTLIIGTDANYGYNAGKTNLYTNTSTSSDTSSSANIGLSGSNLTSVHGSQYVNSSVVTTDGKNALRVMATDETNYVNVAVKFNTKDLSSYTKMTVTYKTEMTLSRNKPLLKFIIGGQEAVLETRTDGEWKTVDIDISSLSGNYSSLTLYGRYEATGLCNGDAVYIQSVTFS